MKRVLFLLTITMLFVTAGCFDNQKTGSKPTGLDKLKAFVEKKATTVVTNGVYVTGVTSGAVTVLYTFPDFMDLSLDKQNTIFANPKAFIVYKDKYIDMPTFYADETVTAASFLNGTNGVKVIIDDKIIPQTVTNLLGVAIKSGTAALVPVPSILQSLESGISDFNTSTFVVRAVFNKPITLNIGDITIAGGKSEATVASITAGAIANSYDITIGNVKDFSAEYTITVKSVEKQEATKVFPYTALKLDVLPALNSNMMMVSQWVTMYNTTSNAIYFQNLSTRILAYPELKEDSSRKKILCLEANGISSYYLSSWIEDSKGNRLTNNIEVTFQSIYGSLAKTSDTFTVVDGYATNKLLSMQNTDVVLDRIKVRVTKTPEDATGYLGRESDFLQVAYMPSPPIPGFNPIYIIQNLSIAVKILRVENSNIADRVVIDFDKSLSASASTLGIDLFDYLNKKNFKDTLIIRDNIRNRNYKIVQWYKLPEDPSKVMAVLDYNLADAGAASLNGTQMLTDNAKHSLVVTGTEYKNDTVTIQGYNINLNIEATSDAFIESGMGVTPVVRSLDFQLKDDISLGYMQIYTETYRQRVLNGETPSAAEKINMLVTKEEELALYVQYSEAVAFDATAGVVNGRLNGITTREGYANNLSNYTINGRLLNTDVVKNVELIEDNPLITTANQQEKDKHTRNTVKITLDKKIVNQLGYNFSYGQNNTPITTTSAVNWSLAKENLFAIAKTGDWAAINNDKANILDSEMKDNFKVNILTNNLPPASVIVYVGNNNPQIWHSSNVKQYDTNTSKRLSPVLAQLDNADNFSPEQFIIKFSSDVYGKVNDLNTILNMTYYNRTITYPQSKIKMSAYKWNDYTKPISESTQVADITTGFNAILVELADWTEVITQPNMYYHNAYREIQFTIPEKSIYISDMIQIQKLNSVISIPVTLKQDWASPRVVTVAAYNPTKNSSSAEFHSTATDIYPADVRFDEVNTNTIIIKNYETEFLLKASEPIQLSDVIIKEDETLSQKWYQKDEKTATLLKPRAGFTNPLTDENEVRFEFYNAEANITYFGRLKRDTMNSEDTMWRIVPCTTSGTGINGTMEIIDVDLNSFELKETFAWMRFDGRTKFAKWKLAIKKIADDAGNSMDTLEWNIEIEKKDWYTPGYISDKYKVATDQDSPRVVWAKMVRDVNIKVGDNFLTTSAIFVKFSHVMQDNTINGVGVLSGYQLDKYRFSQKAQMLRGIYFTNNVGKNITVTENWDGATIILPSNEEYDNNNGVHTLDIPTIKDIYGREIMGITELDLQPISGTDLTVAGAVNRINSLDEDNDGLDEKVSMWVNPYANYDELNNEDSTGNSYSRINKNQDNTALRNIDMVGDLSSLKGVRLYWDINAPYAKEIIKNTDPKNRTYIITRYDELTESAPNLVDQMNIIGEFKTVGQDQPDINGITNLLFDNYYSLGYLEYGKFKRIQVWLVVDQDITTITYLQYGELNSYSTKDYRNILLADLPLNIDTIIKPVTISATTISAIGTTTVTISGKATPNATISASYYDGIPTVADANGDYSIVLTGLMSKFSYNFMIQASLSGFTSYAHIEGTTN